MKNKEEIEKMIKNTCYKDLENHLDIKIRNGQTVQGIKKALNWVLN